MLAIFCYIRGGHRASYKCVFGCNANLLTLRGYNLEIGGELCVVWYGDRDFLVVFGDNVVFEVCGVFIVLEAVVLQHRDSPRIEFAIHTTATNSVFGCAIPR